MEHGADVAGDDFAHQGAVGDIAGDAAIGHASWRRRRAFDRIEQDDLVDLRRLAAGIGQLAQFRQALGQLLADESGAAGDHNIHATQIL